MDKIESTVVTLYRNPYQSGEEAWQPVEVLIGRPILHLYQVEGRASEWSERLFAEVYNLGF